MGESCCSLLPWHRELVGFTWLVVEIDPERSWRVFTLAQQYARWAAAEISCDLGAVTADSGRMVRYFCPNMGTYWALLGPIIALLHFIYVL